MKKRIKFLLSLTIAISLTLSIPNFVQQTNASDTEEILVSTNRNVPANGSIELNWYSTKIVSKIKFNTTTSDISKLTVEYHNGINKIGTGNYAGQHNLEIDIPDMFATKIVIRNTSASIVTLKNFNIYIAQPKDYSGGLLDGQTVHHSRGYHMEFQWGTEVTDNNETTIRDLSTLNSTNTLWYEFNGVADLTGFKLKASGPVTVSYIDNDGNVLTQTTSADLSGELNSMSANAVKIVVINNLSTTQNVIIPEFNVYGIKDLPPAEVSGVTYTIRQ